MSEDPGPEPEGLIDEVVGRFAAFAGLGGYDWRPIAFPTRAIPTLDLSVRLPPRELPSLLQYLRAFRGHSSRSVAIEWASPADEPETLKVGPNGIFARDNPNSAVIAVGSVKTTSGDFLNSLQTPPALQYSRYLRFREVLTATVRSRGTVDYLSLPELSLPRRWVNTAVNTLSAAKISLVAGLEYEVQGQHVRNQALMALVANGVPGAVVAVRLDKSYPAWIEQTELGKVQPLGFEFVGGSPDPLVVEHEGFCFSTLICSDFTNLSTRAVLRGAIDALFVLEWNRDTDGFENIVAASATDLHAYIIQVNNREYGDSWIRAPYCERYKRDILRVKGGRDDFVISGRIDFRALRTYQDESPGVSCEDQVRQEERENKELIRQGNKPKPPKLKFKPVPIGYEQSDRRKQYSSWGKLLKELLGAD